MGPVLDALGPIEAQGRGSLHPHILVWLVAMTMDEALTILLRDREPLKERLRRWMHETVRAVVSVQETSVLQLPRLWLSGAPVAERASLSVPPLPLGPTDRSKAAVDGAPEQTTEMDVDQGHADAVGEPLYVWAPQRDGEDEYVEAVRPQLPLRGNSGVELDPDAWAAERTQAGTQL